MVKKVAVINDLSGFGKCSLTAALPALAAMGVQCCPLPTAILSAQTAFDHFYCDPRDEYVPRFADEWEKLGASFDGIYTGFFTNTAQIDAMCDFIDRFRKDGIEVLVDPILGDDGEPYKYYTDELREGVFSLISRATIITPNLTELCLLTGRDYSDFESMDQNQVFDAVRQMCTELADSHENGSLSVLATGILYQKEGQDMIATGILSDGSWDLFEAPRLPASFSGTGDLYASIIIGGAVLGMTIAESVRLAGKFVTAALEDSIREQVYPPEGTNFEPYLSILTDGVKHYWQTNR